jgi:UDP:flavonoid glycosyltransferase YjiC (YdhE family)
MSPEARRNTSRIFTPALFGCRMNTCTRQAARAQRLGGAMVIPREQLSSEAVAAAVQEVTTNPAYRESARRHSARLRLTDPVAVACAALEVGL